MVRRKSMEERDGGGVREACVPARVAKGREPEGRRNWKGNIGEGTERKYGEKGG